MSRAVAEIDGMGVELSPKRDAREAGKQQELYIAAHRAHRPHRALANLRPPFGEEALNATLSLLRNEDNTAVSGRLS